MNTPHVPHWVYKRLRREEKQIDAVTLLVGLIGPLATIPQLIMIYSTQNAESISLLSWGFYLLASVISAVYSIAHRLKPLFWSSAAWIVIDIILIIGIVRYR